jgi:hypothetical protein
MAEEEQTSKQRALEVRYRPQDPEQPVVVTQQLEYGRELLIKTKKRLDGVIVVEFMNQTFVIPDEEGFLPEALRAAIDKFNEVKR